MNQIIIAGHLGADPEVRFTSSGQKVTTLRVAARARRSGKDETIWWKVTVWGEQFDKLILHLKKGSAVIVSGDLSKPEIFTDKEGRPQVSMNITAQSIMFSPFGRADGSHGTEASSHTHHDMPMTHQVTHQVAQQIASGATHGKAKPEPTFAEDEIPF